MINTLDNKRRRFVKGLAAGGAVAGLGLSGCSTTNINKVAAKPTGDKQRKSHVAKRDFFVNHNMIFISINYRMAPQYQFPDYPQDVASAVAFVINNIQRYGGNSNNIFLMGHSAGAHLAALTSIDNRYLNLVGKSTYEIRGTILLDGAGYDIPSIIKTDKKKRRLKMYSQAFGNEENGWINASPISHIESNSNIPPFLLFYVKKRLIAYKQNTRFGSALRNSNVPANVVPVANSSHRKINESFGAKLGQKEKMTLAFIQKNRV
jgi:acetyl esterase/lipase